MSIWIIGIVLVLGGLEWMAVERFKDNVFGMVQNGNIEEAMQYMQDWHWLYQLDPLFHTHVHEIQQQIFVAQQQEALEEQMGQE